MSALTAATPVTEAVFSVLQDVTLQAAIGGRLSDDIPQDTPRPCVLIEVLREVDTRGLGSGNMPECDLRIHTFSDLKSKSEAQSINLMIVALLRDAALTITGFRQAGLVIYHETISLPDQELHGVKVHEVVSLFTVIAEQTA